MERKRKAILNRLLADIEKSQADEGDVEGAIANFRLFIASLQGEIDYKISRQSFENLVRNDSAKRNIKK